MVSESARGPASSGARPSGVRVRPSASTAGPARASARNTIRKDPISNDSPARRRAGTFVDRDRELASLERFWRSDSAQFIPMTGRRRVGKTSLAEHFAQGKRVAYFRCRLVPTAEQLPGLGRVLADLTNERVLRAEPPTTWSGVFALVDRLAQAERLLLILDELPYWASEDSSLPSTVQNWWDAEGRHLNLMLIICGSAVQMMEHLLTGPAPLAGCVTGRIPVRPLDFHAAAQLLPFPDPVDTLTAYGILGGVPLYLKMFDPSLSIEDNVATALADPTARLYVEPDAVFAADHASYGRAQAMAVLRAMADGNREYSKIQERSGIPAGSFQRVIEPLVGDLGLVERVLPVTEVKPSRSYRTQYVITDNFFRFWFRFIEPNRGPIEFGSGRRITTGLMPQLSDFMGLPFEAMCRDWVSLALGAGALQTPVVKVGTWWVANHQVDVVGLDSQGRVALAGEAKWRTQGFGWDDLETYLGHVRAMGELVLPDVQHVLFSKTGFAARVEKWAATNQARLLTPAEMLAPL
jgi:AAA+ ATPase superfamily predicted ATPase